MNRMLSSIDTGIIFAYLALMVVIGVYASRGQDSIEDFFVAGGKVGTISIACQDFVGKYAVDRRRGVSKHEQEPDIDKLCPRWPD